MDHGKKQQSLECQAKYFNLREIGGDIIVTGKINYISKYGKVIYYCTMQLKVSYYKDGFKYKLMYRV